MGGKSSKEGKKEMIPLQENSSGSGTISLTSDIYVGQAKADPYVDYMNIKFLGEGTFAQVCKVRNKLTGQIRAMKIIKKSSTCSQADDMEILNEINLLKTMDHPNILKIFEFYVSADSYFLVTELCSGGELFQEIIDKGPFNENLSAYLMFQILSAINYCHSMNIVHRDLKPENILISKRENGLLRVKVCDFGTSKMVEKGSVIKKIVGSSYYIAPEVLQKKYNEKCDLWSCGVIMYILLSARPPFEGDDDKEIIERVKTGKYDLTSSPWDSVSNEAKDLISKLLVMDIDKRIDAKTALEHPWFIKNKSKEMFNEIKDQSMIEKYVENLKNYNPDSVIQEAALAYLVHNYPNLDDIGNACKLFNQINKSGNGKITKEELLKLLENKLHKSTLKEDVEIIFKNIDGDNNGYIQYEEFVRAAIDKSVFLAENILKYAFRYFDKDGSGEISYNEIEEVFKSSVVKGNVHDSLKKIISEVDINGDGKISFEEFAHAMRKLLNYDKDKDDF